ncbi:MAG TPA: hypothetical protein DEP47_00825 [Chloroflexi bacterium]|nr:hypothetical protein [Chloroflexota bacterium]
MSLLLLHVKREATLKIIAYLIAAFLGILGFIFLIGFQGQIFRLIIGLVLLIAAGAVVYLARLQPKTTQTTTIQKIDLSGDVNLEEIRCRSCNAPLSKDEIEVRAGAIFVQCGHCGATYQFEEEPKW